MQPDSGTVSRGVGGPAGTGHTQGGSIWRRAWDGWKRLAHKIGVVQTRLVMLLFYFVFVLPLGLVLRLIRDPLHFRHPERTNWVPHPQEPHTLDSAHRQF